MLALTGYANRLSVIAGQSIRFHVSNHSGQALEAGLVRVVCADPNPDIGGVRYEACELPVLELSTPGPQSVPLGSYARLAPRLIHLSCLLWLSLMTLGFGAGSFEADEEVKRAGDVRVRG